MNKYTFSPYKAQNWLVQLEHCPRKFQLQSDLQRKHSYSTDEKMVPSRSPMACQWTAKLGFKLVGWLLIPPPPMAIWENGNDGSQGKKVCVLLTVTPTAIANFESRHYSSNRSLFLSHIKSMMEILVTWWNPGPQFLSSGVYQLQPMVPVICHLFQAATGKEPGGWKEALWIRCGCSAYHCF
jgi:hypothetical protein